MATKPITITFEEPWEMTYIESADNWIKMVESSLEPSDPVYGKEIYVSGKHDHKPLLLVDNDTDDTYAIVEIINNSSKRGYYCKTIKEIKTTKELAEMLRYDHQEVIKKYQEKN